MTLATTIGLRGTFRSLRNRNYRLFWFGQAVSLIGSWMQTVGLGWLVVESRRQHGLGGSGTVLGLITATQFLPTLIGGPWAGLLADRFDKRRILIATQSSAAVIAAILATLTLTHVITIPLAFAVALGTGLVTMVDNPTRQAFVTEMVGTGDVANAVALNSAVFNTARIIGPAIAGVVIKVTGGEGVCFAANAVSFLAVIAGLVAMRPDELFRSKRLERAKGQIRAGLRYAASVPDLRMALTFMAVVGTFAMNFTVILPLVAKLTFHGDAGTLALLSLLMGVGSLFGALVAATRSRPTMRLLIGGSAALGAAMLLAAIAPTFRWECALLVLTGASATTFMSTCNALVQLASRPDMRGRVMAVYMVLFIGSTPIGGPIVGWIGQHASPRWSLTVGGVASVLVALWAAIGLWRRSPRRAAAPLRDEETVPAGALPSEASALT